MQTPMIYLAFCDTKKCRLFMEHMIIIPEKPCMWMDRETSVVGRCSAHLCGYHFGFEAGVGCSFVVFKKINTIETFSIDSYVIVNGQVDIK